MPTLRTKKKKPTASAPLVGGDLGKVLKVVGEGLAGAARVVDDDRDAGACHQAEGHRHTVVVVGVDGHVGLDLLGRGDDAVVPELLNLRDGKGASGVIE